MVDSFGSTRDFTEAQAEAALHIATGDTDDDDGEETGVDPTAETSVGEGSTELPDICLLDKAKPAYPVDVSSLSSTGIPKEFASDNMPQGPSRQSTYFWSIGECKANAKQKALLMTHIHRKHLGVAVGCKYCGKMWWSERSFCGHMEKSHPELDKPDWWTPTNLAKQAEEEAREAAEAKEAMETHSSSTTQ